MALWGLCTGSSNLFVGYFALLGSGYTVYRYMDPRLFRDSVVRFYAYIHVQTLF